MKNLFNLFTLLLTIGLFFTACADSNKATEMAENAAETVQKNAEKATDVAKEKMAQAVAVSNISPGLKVGDKAPDFKLKNVDGSLVSLKEMKDAKGFIVTFTCNHCPYAVLYEDRLIALHNEFAPKGYPVVAINPNDPAVQPEDSYELMKVRAKEKQFPFTYVFDEGQQIYPAYGATRTPHVFLLDKELTVQYIGAIDNNAKDAEAADVHYVKDAIMSLENGKKPDPNYTKAIGCSIKTEKS